MKDVVIKKRTMDEPKGLRVLRVSFPHEDQATHIYRRVTSGKHIWFKQGSCQGVTEATTSKIALYMQISLKCPAYLFDEAAFIETLWNVLGYGRDPKPQQQEKTKQSGATATDKILSASKERQEQRKQRQG